MSREIMQQALSAFEEIMFTKNVGSSHIIAKNARYTLREELAKPANEFHPDWDTLKPYHDRIAELEAQLAKPEYSDLRKAAEMALEALEMHVLGFDGVRKMGLAIEALESALAKPDETETLKRCLFQMQEAAKALAQPEQEPIAWIKTDKENSGFLITLYEENGWTPLYTAPPKPDVTLIDEGKTWQGLTDDEILSFVAFEPHPLMNKTSIIHAVQAKLREKNG